jgi:hypothetical protein
MNGSFGGGIAFGGTIGYKNQRQGLLFELSIESLRSNTVSTEYYDSVPAPWFVVYKREAALTGMNIVPKIGYSVTRGNFSFAFTNGVVISTKLKMRMLYSEESSTWSQKVEEDHSGNTSVGFRSGVSFRYAFYKGLYAGIELTGNFQSWKPEKGEIVKSETNGMDDLASAPYAYSHFVFLDEFVQPGQFTPDDPSQRFSKVYALNGTGVKFSVGIQFHYTTKSGKML